MQMNNNNGYEPDYRMSGQANSRFSNNHDNGVGNYNQNFFARSPEGAAAISIGYQLGKQVLVNNKFTDYFSLNFLKPYFEIDNNYVLRKLKYILLPFIYKNSENNVYDMDNADAETERSDKEKIEYPDFYIPLMSFITYILLIAFNSAYTQGKDLNPDILGMKSTKNFSILLLHTIILKGIFYICSNLSVALLELLSYISYKFVLLNILSLLWIFTKNSTIYYFSLVAVIFLSMIFMQKVLLNKVNSRNEMRTHQKLIVYLVSCLEILTILLITLDLV